MGLGFHGLDLRECLQTFRKIRMNMRSERESSIDSSTLSHSAASGLVADGYIGEKEGQALRCEGRDLLLQIIAVGS